MVIEFKRGASHLGYAYRKGGRAASLPDKICKELIEIGIAIDVTPEKPKRAKVKTADVKKSIKSVVEK